MPGGGKRLPARGRSTPQVVEWRLILRPILCPMSTRPRTGTQFYWVRCLLGAGFALAGCAGPPQPDASADALIRVERVEPFIAGFQLVDSVVLEQRPDAPIVRVSGMARRSDGFLALADVSEGNVKLFASDGRLSRIIGRKGRGPGEFIAPRHLAFAPDGRLLVVDGQLGRLSRFTPDGDLEHTVALEAGFPITGFHLLPDGHYAVAAPSSSRGRVIHLVDTAGRSVDGFVSDQQMRPRIEPDRDEWGYLGGVFFAGDGANLAVAFSLSDSLWLVDATTGATTAVRLMVPGYVQPTPPKTRIGSPQEISAWSGSFHTTSKVLLSRELLLIPFVQGVLNYGDPLILAVRSPDGGWRAYDQAPPPVLVSGDTVYSLLHTQETTRMVLGLHRLRH